MRKYFLAFLLLLTVVSASKKETRYIYQVEPQQLYQSANDKKNLKTTTQFISIAYNDLFGTTITNSQLLNFDAALESLGDKNVIQDLIVKSLINQSGVQIPDNNTMRADVGAFVKNTYLKLYNRQPTEFEAWKLQDILQKNTDITPQMVYYSMMTSDEYKYY